MWIAIGIVGGIVAVVVALALVGACLPRGHVATSSVRVTGAPQAVWDVLADYGTWHTWAPGVKGMERLPDRDGRPAWRMLSRHGAMPWTIESEDPPRRRVTRILDEGLAFGGTWTWEIDPDGAGSRVRLTEDGFVRNLVFRALARFVFGHHATADAFLAALAKRMGDSQARVEHVV